MHRSICSSEYKSSSGPESDSTVEKPTRTYTTTNAILWGGSVSLNNCIFLPPTALRLADMTAVCGRRACCWLLPQLQARSRARERQVRIGRRRLRCAP